jgi:hypothetical protein
LATSKHYGHCKCQTWVIMTLHCTLYTTLYIVHYTVHCHR